MLDIIDSASGLVCTTLVILVCYLLWNLYPHTPPNFPPGPRTYSILGNKEIMEHNSEQLTQLAQIYGGLFSLRFFKHHYIILNDWEIVKQALIGQSEIFSGRPNAFVINQITEKNDVVAIDGPMWKEKRRICVQSLRNVGFGKSSMENVIAEEVSKVIEVLDAKKDEPIKMKELFFMPLLNILWGIVTGNTYRYDDCEMNKIADLVQSHFSTMPNTLPLNALPIMRFLPGDIFDFRKIMHITRELHNYLEKEIAKHLETFKEENEPRDFIDAYLVEIAKRKNAMGKGNHPYQIKHLIGTVFDLLMAGMESSKTTLEWGFLYLAQWPNVQRKVQEELDLVIGRGRLPTYADIAQLPYTEALVLEIHRYASILPLALPHRVTANTTLAGYDIPKDTLVFPNVRAIHHDKKLWGDPQAFRPERFITSDGKVEKPEYFIPFLIGARACIGSTLAQMQLFLFFASILHRYSFSFVSGEILPSIIPPSVKSLTVPPNKYHLNVQERHS